jgi:hypothetical protein
MERGSIANQNLAGLPERPNPAPVDRVGSQDGLLVCDKNGNGVIDNASEIFGGVDGETCSVAQATS